MPSVFLSYRRADCPDTVKILHERLTRRLPHWDIFYDHQSLAPGEHFPDVLRKQVTSANAVLVIIGPEWLNLLRERRDWATDHVRVEVELALESKAVVIPVVAGRAAMPTTTDLGDFPDLQPLCARNGRPLRPDPDFDNDVEPLIVHLEQLDSSETVGTLLAGKYRLVKQIGEGGMGIVFAAEQIQPLERLVAVKLIKPGMDSREVIARFEAERQALALMSHPNIARVLDGGLTAGRRPFFVMEFVRGAPITEYCDDKKLTPQERLELFIPVCQAVQHAHHKGIVHRDLKPSNVLVEVIDGRPVPKVIDFGLAKALGHKLTDKTLYTDLDTRVGTLEYSAPEQAAGRSFDVDTRSDIYSLGILLYELVTGAPPFTRAELAAAGEEEMRRKIREDEPPTPSKRLSSSGQLPALAAKRNVEPKRLTRLVRGDLDWVVMKCVEKEQDRRYETAAQLAEELRRFLAEEPVQAGPPSALYRLRKFLHRHQGAVAAAVLALLALVTGLTVAFIGLNRAARTRQVLLDGVHSARLDGSRLVQYKDTVRLALDRYQTCVDILKDAAADAPGDHELQRELGGAYTNLAWAELFEGKLDFAQIHAEAAVEVAPKRPNLYVNLGHAYLFNKDFARARALYQAHKTESLPPECHEPTFARQVVRDFQQFRTWNGLTEEMKQEMHKIERELGVK